MAMASNYFHPNAAGHGQSHHPPLPNGHQFPLQPQPQPGGVAPYAALGGGGADRGGGGHPYGTAAGQAPHAGPYGAGPTQAAAFSYSNLGLGAYGSLGGGGGPMHAANGYPMMMNGGSGDFKYSSLGASGGPYVGGGNQQQPMGPWNPQQQQQQQRRQHQDYLGHPYNHNPNPAYPGISYVANHHNHGRVPVAIPPPPPPLPEEAFPDATRRTPWGDASREEGGGTASLELEEGEVAPEDDPPPRRPSPNVPPNAPAPTRSPVPPDGDGTIPLWVPPPPPPAASRRPPREAASSPTDRAVDAINALSSLQSRWGVPGAKADETKNQRKNRRRRLQKRERARKNRANNNPPVVLREAGEDGDPPWIDVEDAGASDKRQKRDERDSGPPASKKRKSDGGAKDFEDVVSNLYNFPPLAPSSQGGDKDDARPVTLEDLSTPQLASYSAALRGSLDAIGGGGADPAPKSEENALDGARVEDEEMDISDEEEAAQTSKNSDGIRPEGAKSGEASRETAINLAPERPPAERIGSAAEPEAPAEDAPDDAAAAGPPPRPDRERIEREKRALKLAELRAKAKLARAKLRIAEQKKARGNAPPASASATAPGSLVSASPPPARVRDIAVGSLVIEDVSLTGPPDEVRFVDSVYKPSSRGDQVVQEQIIAQDSNKSVSVGPTEENRKKSESLKQKLQLARLQLEMKKKELNKRKALSSATNGDTATPDQSNQPLHMKTDKGENVIDDTPPKDPTPRVKLEQLRRRQKELKQKNDVANLRNLIHRQRGLLKAQSQELSESSAQLQSCIDGIRSKRALLDASEQRLQEMHHRKRIIEGMVYRATEQLIAARKVLSERRRHQPDPV